MDIKGCRNSVAALICNEGGNFAILPNREGQFWGERFISKVELIFWKL